MTTGVGLLDGTGMSADERLDFLALLGFSPASRLLEVGDGALDAPEESLDCVLCIDAIARVPNRGAVLAAWARAVRPGGRILYTDPAIVAGLVTNDELAIRGGTGIFVFSPQGENESLIDSAGLRLLRADDATDALSRIALRRRGERDALEAELVTSEGRALYDARQRFLDVTHRLAAERRLARIAFLMERAS